MITIKYKGEIVDIKDIEITWQVETCREWLEMVSLKKK